MLILSNIYQIFYQNDDFIVFHFELKNMKFACFNKEIPY